MSCIKNRFDQNGKTTSKQIVVPDSCMDNLIRTLDENPMQGQPGASKTLKNQNFKYCAPDITRKVQGYSDNCQMFIGFKTGFNMRMQSLLEKIYAPCDGYTNVMEIKLVWELLVSIGNTHILSTCDVFSRNFFAVPQPSSQTVPNDALLQYFVQHAYVPNQVLIERNSVFTGQLLEYFLNESAKGIEYATLKNATLRQTFNFSFTAVKSHWVR